MTPRPKDPNFAQLNIRLPVGLIRGLKVYAASKRLAASEVAQKGIEQYLALFAVDVSSPVEVPKTDTYKIEPTYKKDKKSKKAKKL